MKQYMGLEYVSIGEEYGSLQIREKTERLRKLVLASAIVNGAIAVLFVFRLEISTLVSILGSDMDFAAAVRFIFSGVTYIAAPLGSLILGIITLGQKKKAQCKCSVTEAAGISSFVALVLVGLNIVVWLFAIFLFILAMLTAFLIIAYQQIWDGLQNMAIQFGVWSLRGAHVSYLVAAILGFIAYVRIGRNLPPADR